MVSTVIIHYIIFNLGEIVNEITANITTSKMRCNTFHISTNTPPNQHLKNDFAQSFSLAFIIRKNALILYSFSEEKEVQNGLFYHFIYKTLVVNWSNMLHRQVKLIIYTQLSPKQNDERFSFIDSLGCSVLLSPISKQRLSII